jgi:hypothetical protein
VRPGLLIADMTSYTRFFRLSLIALLFLTACGKSDTEPPVEELVVVERVGSEGGALRLESADGSSFELRIPAGALSAEQEITIRKLPAASWPSETEENPPVGGAVFEMLPEGLTFQTPVTTISRFSQSPASLGMGSNNVFPSQVSRSSAGAVERHPTALTRQSAASVVVGRTSHFSTHWVGTQTAEGEFGVNVEWPAEPDEVGYVVPTLLTLWTSSAAATSLPYRMGVFVPEPLVAESSPPLSPGYWETATSNPEAELLSVLREHLDALDDERLIHTYFSVSYDLEGLPLADLQEGMPYVIEEWDMPNFYCYWDGVGDGIGAGWLVVQIFIDGDGETPVPLTYVTEVSFDCSPFTPL